MKQRHARRWTGLVAAGLILGPVVAARALINPNFTPVHLMGTSELILLVKVGPVDEKGKATAEVKEVLKSKGKAPAKTHILDIQYLRKDDTPRVKELLAAQGDQPVLLFSGKGQNDELAGFLHLSGRWIEIEPSKEADTWDVLSTDARSGSEGMGMEATWAGGTDMLLSLVRLLKQHPDLHVPVDGGASWEEHVQIGKLEGKIHRMMPVDLAGKGENLLFVAAEQGDRLYGWDGKANKFEDRTAARQLKSKTRVGAWGDFNGDGRMDLASWDGRDLVIWAQGEKGVFSSVPAAHGQKGECGSLQALDVGVKGRAGLVWGSAGGAVVLVPDKEKPGVFTGMPLAADAALLQAMGPGGKCLVADFDGDRLPDILLMGAESGILYRARSRGVFEPGKACAVALGSGVSDGFLGDWDADGRLDVFTVSADGRRLWENKGAGRFVNRLGLSGELAYISQPRGITGNACDFNNDGRQDIFIAYGAETGPQLFFNRLFRSFGHAHKPLDVIEIEALPEALSGQQAGVVADFTHDGAQDMAFALLTGELYVFIRSVESASCLAARVALAPGSDFSGPVSVWGHNGIHPTGAWAVMPGVGEAFIGQTDAGELNLHWQGPGEAEQKATKLLESGPMRFVLPGGK